MNVVVEIEGREALPVWTLPNITGWQFSPDWMLTRLVDSCHDGYPCVFPEAFRVINGRHYPIEQVTLNEIKNIIDRLESETKARNDKLEWQERSIKVLYQQYSGMYVWLDEFRKWFAHYVYWNTRCHYEPYSLCLYGELVQHFIDNELKIFKQKTTSVDSYSSGNVARNPENVVVGDLLAFTITDLLNKFELVNNDEYKSESDYESDKDRRQGNTDERRYYLYLWQLLLTDETAFVREADYENEAKREAKLKKISDRLKEIKLRLADCPIKDDSEPSIPNYGEPELLPSDAINFYQAKNLLGNDWTAEEFALQVYFGGIRAFEKNNYEADKFRPYTHIAADWLTECFKAEIFSGKKYSIKKLLLCFNYSESELSKFKPDYRYTSYQQAITQISALTAIRNIEDADMFLIDAIEQNKITAFHPLVGTVTPELSMNGEYWRTGYFPEWKLEKLIINAFGEMPNKATENVNSVALQEDWRADINYGKTLTLSELMQRWGNNFELINDFSLDKKILPFLDGRAAYVCKLNSERTFLFPQMATDEKSYIVEDIEDYPKYTKLPNDTKFYLTDISRFEEENPTFKKQVLELERERAKDEKTEKTGNNGVDIQPDIRQTTAKTPRTRRTNLSKAIDAAIEAFGKKPSFDELWRFFHDDKDQTGHIEDFTDTHITWKDTKGKLHDTQKETIQNQLSQR